MGGGGRGFGGGKAPRFKRRLSGRDSEGPAPCFVFWHGSVFPGRLRRMEVCLPDDLEIDLEGSIDAQVPELLMLSALLQKAIADLLKWRGLHEIFQDVCPEAICGPRQQGSQLPAMARAGAYRGRVNGMETAIPRSCGLQKGAGKSVRVVEISYTSQVVSRLDGVQGHDDRTSRVEDIPH